MSKKLLAISMAMSLFFLLGCDSQNFENDVVEEKDPVVMDEDMHEDEHDHDMEEDVEEFGYIDLSPEEAFNLSEENPELVIIDVSPNYDEGHLPGAINYYVGDGSLDAAIDSLDMELTYLVYCHVESASRLGAQKLVDAGFENVYRLEGDYPAWVDAGYAVEK